MDHRIRKDTTRNIVKDPRLEYVNSREHQRRLTTAVRDRHAAKSRDPTRFCVYNAETLTTGVGQQHECRDRVSFAMCLECGVQIDVSDELSINDDERLVLEERARVVERAARAEYHRLFNVMKLHTEATAITERAPHRVRTMMQVHDDLIDTVASEIFSDVSDERLSEDGNRGFGAVFSEWPKACAVAGRKNDCAHRSGSLGGVAHDEVEGAGGDFAKAGVAVE